MTASMAAVADSLSGGEGDDVLDGGSGIDTASGGRGNDTYYVDNAGDQVSVWSGQGTDLVYSSVSFSLDHNAIENLILTGSGNIAGVGNDLNNLILGNSGSNRLTGGLGADFFFFNLGSGADRIWDFSASQGDVIFLYDCSHGVAYGGGVTITKSGANTLMTWAVAIPSCSTVSPLTTRTSSTISSGRYARLSSEACCLRFKLMLTFSAGLADIRGACSTSGGITMISTLNRHDDQVVNTYTSGPQGYPRIARLADGGYIISWDSYEEDGSVWGVYAQRFDSHGQPVGAEFQASAGYLGNQQGPHFAVLPNGNLVVAWSNYILDGLHYEVYSRIFDGNGTALTGDIHVNTHTDNFQGYTTVIGLADNSYVVTWTSYDQDETNTYGIYAQRFASDGTTIGAETQVNTVTVGDQVFPDGVALSDGGYVIVWSGASGSGYTSHGQRFDATGAPVGVEFETSGIASDLYTAPAVAATADGGFIITWRNTSATTDAVTVFAQRYAATGVATGGPITVAAVHGDHRLVGGSAPDYQSVAVLSDGGFVVAVGDFIDIDQGYKIEVQRFTAAGAAIGPALVISPATGDSSGLRTSLAALAGGGFVVTWEGLDGDQTGPRQAVFESTGDLSGTQYVYGDDFSNDLTGGAGADFLYGGPGNDTYHVDNSADVIGELAGQGHDLVIASSSYALASRIEDLTLIGAGNFNGIGNGLANIITGNDGANTLNGGGGADTLSGGKGNDAYGIDSAGDLIVELVDGGVDRVQSTVSYTLADNVENLSLGGTANINGTGNTLANSIVGNAGDNVLNGGGGIDKLYGREGNDTYIIDNAGVGVSEGAPGGIGDAGGNDTVMASVSWRLGLYIENLTLTGTAGINGVGNALDNVLTGNAANNYLTGEAGNDTLIGGQSYDMFFFAQGSGQDVITDFSAAQRDRIYVRDYSHGVAYGGGITISQDGTDAVIDLGGGNTVTVLNTTVAQLNGQIVW